MRETDEWAIETRGVPSLELMERAGEGLARVIGQHGPAGRIAIVCGKGNNGGDGLVAARLLRQAGREVEVLAVWDPQHFQDDAATMLGRLPGAAPVAFAPDRLARAHVIVDALLGTGFTGAPREPGGDGDQGDERRPRARGRRRRAQRRQRVHRRGRGRRGPRAWPPRPSTAAKPGLWIAPGKAYAGEVEVIDIGIPSGSPVRAQVGLIGARRPARRCRAAARSRPSSPPATCSSSAGRAGSRARRRWRRWRRCAPAPATSRSAARRRSSCRSRCGCWRR